MGTRLGEIPTGLGVDLVPVVLKPCKETGCTNHMHRMCRQHDCTREMGEITRRSGEVTTNQSNRIMDDGQTKT